MSTKAEIKKRKELKKKIGLGMKALLTLGLVILGLIYYGSGKDKDGDDIPINTDSITETKEDKDTGIKALNSKNMSPATNETGDNSSIIDGNIDKNVVVSEPDKSDNIVKDLDKDTDNNTDKNETVSVKETTNHYNEDGRLNINLATVDELCKLNGIGAKRAADIIEYRETYGNFKKTEDIMKVKGIKQGVFSKIKDEITCD